MKSFVNVQLLVVMKVLIKLVLSVVTLGLLDLL